MSAASGWLARVRVTARMARRQARRTLRSSVLVVLLVALPVAALGTTAIVANSAIGTPAQQADVALGHNQAYLQVVSGPDPSLRQHPSDPNRWRIDYHTAKDPTPVNPQLPWLPSPASLLPVGTRLIPVSAPVPARVVTAGGVGSMNVIVGDVAEPSFAGRFDVIEGRAPTRENEIMATRSALERLGARLGDTVALSEPALVATVTGLVDFAEAPDARELLFVPWAHAEAFDFSTDSESIRWYLPGPALTWAEVHELNAQGITALSREVALDPPVVDSEDFPGNDHYWQQMGETLLLLGAGAVFAAYQVLLLAGAAFAVSSRRQRQALATAASVGAAPAEVRRIVLLQGMVLGLIGGLAGLALGAAAAWAFLRLADTGDRTLFWGYNVPWWQLAGILLFAVLVGTLSALAPARGAARVEVLAALRGARKPPQLSRKRPVWGSVLLLAGLGLAVTGTVGAFAMSRISGHDLPWDSPLRLLPSLGIIAGPLLVQIGGILAGAWLLHLLSRAFSRISLGARLASRDTAANASRSVPAFASIAAAVFLAVFALSMVGTTFAKNERTHIAQAPLGSAHAEVWAATPEEQAAGAALLAEELRTAGATATAIVSVPDADGDVGRQDDLLLPRASFPHSALCTQSDALSSTSIDACLAGRQHTEGRIVVIDPADLPTVLGVDLPAETMRAFASGSALTPEPLFVENGRVEVGFWPAAEVWDGGPATGPSLFTQDRAHAVSWTTLPAIIIEVPVTVFPLILAPATAGELGIVASAKTVIASFAEAPSARTIDAITQVGQSTIGPWFWLEVENGADQPWRWYLLTVGIAAILVLGASAVSIGLARFDGRADDATLAAVGGTHGIRRSISFWQAIVIVGVGAWCGALTGLLPSWGFVQAIDGLRLRDVPWLLVSGIALGLPLMVAAGAWLLSPRPALLTRRTAIT